MLKVVEVRLPRTKESPVSSQFKYGLTALIAVTVFRNVLQYSTGLSS